MRKDREFRWICSVRRKRKILHRIKTRFVFSFGERRKLSKTKSQLDRLRRFGRNLWLSDSEFSEFDVHWFAELFNEEEINRSQFLGALKTKVSRFENVFCSRVEKRNFSYLSFSEKETWPNLINRERKLLKSNINSIEKCFSFNRIFSEIQTVRKNVSFDEQNNLELNCCSIEGANFVRKTNRIDCPIDRTSTFQFKQKSFGKMKFLFDRRRFDDNLLLCFFVN